MHVKVSVCFYPVAKGFFSRLSKTPYKIGASSLCSALSLGIAAFHPTAYAQKAHFSGAQTTIPTSTLNYPYGVAVDTRGDVYVANSGLGKVLKENLSTSGYSESSIGSGLYFPASIAIDPNGNVYIADTDNNRVLKETLSGGAYTQTQISSGFLVPYGIAVDGSGNVYIADTGNNRVLKETPSGSSYVEKTIASGSNFVAVAVDSGGNVYVTDANNKQVLKETYSVGTYSQSTVVAGLGEPEGVAVDQNGNVFIADTDFSSNGVVWKETPSAGSYSQSQVYTSSIGPLGIAVDSNDNLYVTNIYTSQVMKLHLGVNFNSVNVGTATLSIPLSFTFDSPGSISAPVVVTQGVAGLDFKDDGTGSCTTNGTSHTYNIGDSCTVDVTFTPKFAGPRYGAVELEDNSGNVIVTVYIQGTGVGPQVGFLPANLASLSVPNLNGNLNSIAIDGQGNLYIAENIAPYQGTSMVVKETWTANAWAQSTVMSGLDQPLSIAVDAAGNVYVADISSYQPYVATPTATGYTKSSLSLPASGFRISSVAVDGSGNIYLSDELKGLQKLAYQGATGYTQSTIDSSFWTSSLAVDSAGNLYFSNPFPTAGGGSTLGLFKETLNNGTYTQSTIASGSQLGAVALDGNGNIYSYDAGTGQLLEWALSGGTYTESAISFPVGANHFVFDPQDNVFALNSLGNVSKLDISDPPSLNFATTMYGSTSADSPQTVTVGNIGNATLHFPVPGSGANPSIGSSFTLDTNASSACPVIDAGSSAPGTLAAGTSCALSISFTPQFGGPISDSLVLADDAFNQTSPNYATQTIVLNGTGTHGPAPITWATPSAIVYGTPLGASQLNATSTAAGTFSYSPAAGTVVGGGTQTLTVTFTPTDTTDYIASTETVSLLVNKATPSNSLVTSTATSFLSNLMTLTATLTSSAGSPTGAVSFYDGTTLLGTGTLNAGVATCTPSTLTVGTHSITAAYSGDANFLAATSAVVSEVVEDFTFASQNGGSATASPGGQATYSFSVAPPSGASFPQGIDFSVSGLPTGAVAAFSPTSVAAGSGATNVSMTVTLPASAALQQSQHPFGSGALPVALGLMLLPFIADPRKFSRNLARTACLTILVIGGTALVAAVAGCVGGGSSSSGTSGNNTQPQNYTLTVAAASGSLSHTMTVSLTVK